MRRQQILIAAAGIIGIVLLSLVVALYPKREISREPTRQQEVTIPESASGAKKEEPASISIAEESEKIKEQIREQAEREFKEAQEGAARGEPDALFKLSTFYLAGAPGVVEPDHKKFVDLTLQAADKGQPLAMENAGAILYHQAAQFGLKPDLNASLAWYEKLANDKSKPNWVDGARNAGYLYGLLYKQTHDAQYLKKAEKLLEEGYKNGDTASGRVLVQVLSASDKKEDQEKSENIKKSLELQEGALK